MATKVLFPLGQTVQTPGAASLGVFFLSYLTRHVTGDWGDLCDEDKAANDEAVKVGTRVFSSYIVDGQTKIWIITEADRSVTTVLLPSEY